MSAVEYQVAAGVATMAMDQPQSRNALTPALLNGLGDSLAAASADSTVRVVVLTNTGPAFCAGADLRGNAAEEERHDLAAVLQAILACPKPVVARIAGHCLGGGVGLAAACDLSIATEDSLFGFTEVRLGVIAAIISPVCLPKLRRGDAMELYLTGERIDARRAAEVGLISAAVPTTRLDAAIAALVDHLKAGAPAALAASKRLVLEPPGQPGADVPAALAAMTELSKSVFASTEAAEGIAAFREKRSPSWNL